MTFKEDVPYVRLQIDGTDTLNLEQRIRKLNSKGKGGIRFMERRYIEINDDEKWGFIRVIIPNSFKRKLYRLLQNYSESDSAKYATGMNINVEEGNLKLDRIFLPLPHDYS